MAPLSSIQVSSGRCSTIRWGVALKLTSEAREAMISWEPINCRINTARFRTRQKKITVLIFQSCAPTNEEAEEDKYDSSTLLARQSTK